MHFVLLFIFVVVATEGAFDLDEGDVCDLYGDQGICRKISDCPSALNAIKQRKALQPPVCKYINFDAIVCCETNKGKVLTTTERSSDPVSTEYVPTETTYVDLEERAGEDCGPVPREAAALPTGQKAWDKCLEYQEKYVFPCEKSAAISGDLGRVNRCHHNADELVIGGTDVALHEFPHMVLLGYKTKQGTIVWQCGGALISEKFVLTAGHCISDKSQNNVSHALIGVLRRSDDASEKRYGIKRIIEHGDYHSPTKYNDIALLELDKEVKLDHRTVPACLDTGAPVDASRASATGWGTTSEEREVNSEILQKVILTSFSASECASVYGYNRHMKEGYRRSSQICYGDRTKSQDTCRGDSGGPLHVKSKQIACMYIVVGVTSFGIKCGLAGVPGIYTRVAHFVPWIQSVVWPN